jgi:two-component system, NarL family, sensor histidine kinase UhpB
VTESGRLQDRGSTVVYVIAALIVLAIGSAAVWTVMRDYRVAVEHASLHLDNVTVVLAEHTRFALQTAPVAIGKHIEAAPSGDAERELDDALQVYFHELFSRIELAYKGRVVLFRPDGAVVASYPALSDGRRETYADHPLLEHAKRFRSGSLEGPGIVDPGERLIAYRRIADYPVLVVVSSPMSSVLATWRRDAAIVVLGAVLFAALTAAAAFLLGREWRLKTALMADVAERQMRLDSIIGSAMDAIITIDEEHNVCLFNTAAEKIFKCSASEAMYAPLDRFIPERFRAAHRAHVERFGRSGATMRRMGETMVLYGVRSTGQEFPIDASISHVTVAGKKFYTVILRDITERQRSADELQHSHQELRELYGAMHEVREGERTRIARELHDELAQWLTALKMDASWIASRLPREHEQLVTKAERMKGVVDNTVAAIRRIAADLRPVMLDDLGLVPAIENLLYDLSERAGITVNLTGSMGDAELKEPYATAVYRMVQEALTNVARHSGATAVEVHVAAQDDQLLVRIKDNGRGFNPDPERKTFGVLGIRERARTLGGGARIFSPEEGGTVVEIEITLETRTAELAL